MLSSAIAAAAGRTAGVDVNKINHADIPGFLKSQGAIGLGGYQKLLDFGHSKSALDAAIKNSGIKIGSKLQASMPSRVPAASSSGYTAPGIGNLSAHDYNKVRTSFDQYQATQNRPRGLSRMERGQFENAGRQASAARQGVQKGGSYGIEDEYRFMLSPGFQPQGLTPVPAAPAPAPEPQRNTGPVDPAARLNVGTQPQVDPMAMYMPLLLEALRPKPPQPIQQLPEPTTYASAGQAARSVPGVKIRRSSASSSGQNTLGTSGSFNRSNLRISNLNI